MIYGFDDIEIDTDRYELRRGGVAQPVEPQVFAVIELLVANHGRVVTKDELNQRVWGGRFVSEAVVNSRISSARRAIGDDGAAQRLIRTVRNRGFRFVGTPQIEDGLATAAAILAERAEPGMTVSGVAPSVAAAAEGRPSIAVLPFAMLAGVDRYPLLADAVSHEIIVELSRLRWLFVIARGSSFRFRGPDVDLQAARRLLGVRYFLTGGVAVEGRRSVVTAELADADDGHVLWADRFEGPVDELVGLRRTIAAHVVTALELRIPLAEAQRVAAMPAASLDGWSAYHRGLWHMYRFNAHDNAVATHLFTRAVDADPGFARAYAGLSFTHFQNAFVGFTGDNEEQRRLTRMYAEQSLELDPLDPFANLTVGRAHQLGGDLEGAVGWFERAIELNPNYAFAIYNRSLVDALSSRGAEAEAGTVRALALSPLDPLQYAMLGSRALSHIVRGDFAAARSWAERAATAPNAHVQLRVIAAFAHELAGDRVGAQRWATVLRRSGSGYARETFFAAFPFRDDAVAAAVAGALDRLGL